MYLLLWKKVKNKRQEYNVTFELDVKTEWWAGIGYIFQGKEVAKRSGIYLGRKFLEGTKCLRLVIG